MTLWTLGACEDPVLWTGGSCRTDLDCSSLQVCWEGRCGSPLEVRCPAPVADPAQVDFGTGPGTPRRRVVQVFGEDCPVATEIRIEGEDANAFACSSCPGLWSGSRTDLAVWFTPSGDGPHRAELVLAGPNQTRRVPLIGRRSPGPQPWTEPPVLDLGWVQAPIHRTVSLYALSPPAGSWTTEAPVGHGLEGLRLSARPQGPAVLQGRPLEAAPPHRWTVEFAPTPGFEGEVQGSLRWLSGGDPIAEIPVRAQVGTPPKVVVDETPRHHRASVGEAVQLQIPLANLGGAELELDLIPPLPWSRARGPDRIRVPPGGQSTWLLTVVPTEPELRTGSIRLATNDPDRPRIEVERTLDATPAEPRTALVQASIRREPPGFTEDIRAFALEVVTEDGVRIGPGGGQADWARWSGVGRPADLQTLALEPTAGRHRIEVRSLSDCRSVPGKLLSAILGVAASALWPLLWRELASGAWGAVADGVSQTCLARGPSRVAISVRSGAGELLERTLDLQASGVARTVGWWTEDGRFEVWR